MSDDDTIRPSWACVLCPPPKGPAWWPADNGYRTCSRCLDSLREQLSDISRRYLMLDPRPGGAPEQGGRGAPGFGSRAPGSVHIMAMRDRRSSPDARVWIGKDGRVHQEPERPPLSVWGVLDGVCWSIAEARGVNGPDSAADVHELTRWADRHLDWLTRQELVVDVAGDIRLLLAQLKPVTGEPSKAKVGHCPNETEGGTACGAILRAPTSGDVISCRQCGREWPRPEWEHLGRLIGQLSA